MEQLQRDFDTAFELTEIKRPIRHTEIDLDSLSEWELARMTSKTWSMEQE